MLCVRCAGRVLGGLKLDTSKTRLRPSPDWQTYIARRQKFFGLPSVDKLCTLIRAGVTRRTGTGTAAFASAAAGTESAGSDQKVNQLHEWQNDFAYFKAAWSRREVEQMIQGFQAPRYRPSSGISSPSSDDDSNKDSTYATAHSPETAAAMQGWLDVVQIICAILDDIDALPQPYTHGTWWNNIEGHDETEDEGWQSGAESDAELEEGCDDGAVQETVQV